jgi:alkylation response protein AidB-like acyl-CoA dehydrogenase
MDFNLTDEQRMLRDGAERFLLENYTFERRRRTLDLTTRCDDAAWQSFAELGWLALTIPEEAGGLGAGLVEAVLLAEAIGRRMVIEPLATTAMLGAGLIERGTNVHTRNDLLGAIAAGDLRVAIACYEPGRRYELTAPVTRARRTAEGFVLSGSKMLVLDAPAAQKFIVTADIEGGAGFGLFVMNSDTAGVTQCSYPLIDGRRAADLELVDVEIPASALLCDPANAPGALDEALDRFMVFQVADALGAMEAVMEQTAEHLRNRKQFGQPLAAFQALQHRMAEMFVEVQETRSALYHALAHIDADSAVRNAAVSSAVVVASEAGRVVGGQGIQLHGGVGMTDEYQVGHFFKRLLVHEKSWGDVDFHLDRIAHTYR